MSKSVVSLLALSLCMCFGAAFTRAQSSSQTQTSAAAGTPKLDTDEQKTLYALGILLGRNVKTFSLTAEELAIVKAGLTDAAMNATPQVDLNVYGPKVNEMAQKRAAGLAETEKKKGADYLDNVAKQPNAIKTASGIVIRTIKAGEGFGPSPTDVVKVNYEGKLIDGTVFDSSIARGQPAEFPLNKVIPCWTEALQKMTKGEKAQIVCPSTLGYGDRGSPPLITPGATLSFEVELLDFHKP